MNEKRKAAAAKGVETRRRNREAKQQAIADIMQRVQAICDANSGRHLFEGGHGLSCFVSVTADVNGRSLQIRNAAYGHGLQLGAEFDGAMTAAGFGDFEISLD
jgi:hypothetical protein